VAKISKADRQAVVLARSVTSARTSRQEAAVSAFGSTPAAAASSHPGSAASRTLLQPRLAHHGVCFFIIFLFYSPSLPSFPLGDFTTAGSAE